MAIELGADDATPMTDLGPSMALSPDGQTIAFVAQKADAPVCPYSRSAAGNVARRDE
jgi:hypothetical protein